MPIVYIPSPLRGATGGQRKIQATGATLRTVLTELERRYPGVRQQVCDETGEVRSFINVFVNGTEIRQLQGLATPLGERDEVAIIPAMAGGGAPRPQTHRPDDAPASDFGLISGPGGQGWRW
jgi:molybdopterin synthase sulfur carrier subunit